MIAGKVIAITGASAGIGKATAVHLAADGAHLILIARRQERLEALAASLPGEHLTLAADVSDLQLPQRLVDLAVARWGRLDVLINNAGIGHNGPLVRLDNNDAEKLLQTNLLGLLRLCQGVIPQMQRQGSGQIINISSIVGQRPMPNSGLYCASKTAVNFLTRTLRIELTHEPITISLVYPGLTSTEFPTAVLGDARSSSNHQKWGTAPEKVAVAIGKAISKQQTEIYITWYDWLFTHLNRLFPRTVDALLGWRYQSKH